MNKPESRISTHEIPHFQHGEVRAVEETARMILNAGLDTFDQTHTFGKDSPLEYCSAKKNVLEITYARRFSVGGYEVSKITLAVRLDDSSLVVVVEDSLQHPLLETFVRITKECATISSYANMTQTEDTKLTNETARNFRHQLMDLVDYFAIIPQPQNL